MGQLDGSFEIALEKNLKKVLGITCHDSIELCKKSLKFKPDYLAFGSFFKSKLKPKAKIANFKNFKTSKKCALQKPIVVIGGINNLNYKKLLKLGANYIAISSFIWDNPKLKPNCYKKI